jgi:hypothetical protein
MLSLAIAVSPNLLCAAALLHRPNWGARGRGAQAEIGSLEHESRALARLQPLVRRLQRKLDGDRRIGCDPFQDRLRAGDQVGGWNNLVDQADAIAFLRGDHLSGENELQGPPLAHEPGQPLCSSAAGKESQCHLGLAELRLIRREPDGAGHRGLAPAAESKAVDGRDHRLAQVFDEIEDFLAEAARLLRLKRREMCELAYVCASDKRLVAGSCKDDASHFGVVSRGFERGPQILPGRRIECVEHLRTIERDIGNRALLPIKRILKTQWGGGRVLDHDSRRWGSHWRLLSKS